jgi:hypothetical protein
MAADLEPGALHLGRMSAPAFCALRTTRREVRNKRRVELRKSRSDVDQTALRIEGVPNRVQGRGNGGPRLIRQKKAPREPHKALSFGETNAAKPTVARAGAS